MIIIPAIDILDGQCVRLRRGEYGTAHNVAENAVETALTFKKAGAEYLHIVDLNGAASGNKTNAELIVDIISSTGMKTEVGGGIRTRETVRFYLENGADRVILGSSALASPDFVKRCCEEYPGKIAVGIDAKRGMVAINGWTETSLTDAFEFAKIMEKSGVSGIIYTEIERDGMLCGIDAGLYAKLKNTVSVDITASGGIRDEKDIESLAKIGIYGAICGKSIYEGTLSLENAIKIAANYN